MNFFGHAWVAGWFSEQAPFILGSMLPDFANALRVAAPTSLHPELDAGIRLHHETDRVFHATSAFRELDRGARSVLATLGLPKGARRALAHVGVEFLIDEQLQRRTPDWTGYAGALHFGSSEACRDELCWSAADASEHFSTFCRRLARSTPGDTRRLAARLVATLAGRPRLELEAADAERVEPWLAAYRSEVVAHLPSLLTELGRELRAPADVRAPQGAQR